MHQPVTPAISTLCWTQDPPVNVNCHYTAAVVTSQMLLSLYKIITALFSLVPLQTCQHIYIYIYIYNAIYCTAINRPVQCCWFAEGPALNVQRSKCYCHTYRHAFNFTGISHLTLWAKISHHCPNNNATLCSWAVYTTDTITKEWPLYVCA